MAWIKSWNECQQTWMMINHKWMSQICNISDTKILFHSFDEFPPTLRQIISTILVHMCKLLYMSNKFLLLQNHNQFAPTYTPIPTSTSYKREICTWKINNNNIILQIFNVESVRRRNVKWLIFIRLVILLLSKGCKNKLNIFFCTVNNT